MDHRDDDVLENEPRRPRRGLLALAAAVVVVALGLLAFVRFGGLDHQRRDDRADATSTPAASKASWAWPTAKGACGGDVPLPLVSATKLGEPTGLTVLAAGSRLVRVDVDSGRSTVLGGVPRSRHVGQLVAHGSDVYASTETTCTADRHAVMRVGPGGARPLRMPGSVDTVVAGATGVWGVDYPKTADGRAVLRSTTGRTVRLPKGADATGVTSAGFVGAIGNPARTVLFDAETGRVAREIGTGYPMAVGARFVLWPEDARCTASSPPPSSSRCVLHRTELRGAGERAYRLPNGRVPTSQAVLSADGRYAAFQLGRREPDRRYRFDHPGNESDVAVLDLRTSELQVVPGLELPPKVGLGLAFSPDAGWLVLTTNQGGHGALYLWRRGADRLLRSPARIPGPLGYGVPVLVTG